MPSLDELISAYEKSPVSRVEWDWKVEMHAHDFWQVFIFKNGAHTYSDHFLTWEDARGWAVEFCRSRRLMEDVYANAR